MYVRPMQQATAAPADLLAQLPGMAPGPELAAALAALHLPAVPNGRVVDVLRAHYRQLAHAHAGLLAALLEVARTTPYFGSDDPATQGPGRPRAGRRRSRTAAEGEIAAALRWTPGKAGWELPRAQTLVQRLPAVYAALAAGLIDRPKADVFAEYLDPERLTRAQIGRLVTRFLPPAQKWTRRQLAARLLRAIVAIDPHAARDRYRQAVRERGVSCYLHEGSATAVITADGLPPDEAAAACARLDRLAAKVERAGHPGRLRQIAADLFLGMLDGRWSGWTEPQIIADLLSRRRPEDQPLPEPRSPPSRRAPPAPTRPRARFRPTRAIDAPRGHRTRARPSPSNPGPSPPSPSPPSEPAVRCPGPPRRRWRRGPGSRSGSGWPPCWAATTGPGRSPGWAR